MFDEPPPRIYPRFWQAVRLVLGLFVIQTVLLIALGIFAGSGGPSPFAGSALDLLAYGIVLRWGIRRTGVPERDVFPFKALRAGIVIASVLTIFGAGLFGGEAAYLLAQVLPEPESFRALEREALVGVTGAVRASVIGPILEELLFRGLILRGFLAAYPRRQAVFLSALLFGLFHLSPWQGLSAFGLGLLLGWWRAETGSLWPCFAGHILWNAAVTVVQAFPSPQVPPPTLDLGDQLFLVGLGAVFFGAGILLRRRLTARAPLRAAGVPPT